MCTTKSLQGSKLAMIMSPVSIELTFVVINSYIELPCYCVSPKKNIKYFSSIYILAISFVHVM